MIQAGATNVDPNAAAIPLSNATFIIYLPEARVDAGGGDINFDALTHSFRVEQPS
jgi:hypothetical protein